MANGLNAGPYQPLIDASAAKYSIDPAWLTRLLHQENGFRPTGTSPAGAQGIAQFMPGTAARYGVNVNDPASSIEGAAHYLSDNLKQFGGNVGLATAAYNWGEGNVQKWIKSGGNVPKETQQYVSNITGTPIATWAGAGGASSRLAATPTQATPTSAAPGPIDPSIIARGGVSPPIPGAAPAPASPTIGTTLAGIGAQASDADFTKGATALDKAWHGDQSPGQEGGQAAAFMPVPARNVSPLLPMARQVYGNTLTSMATPLQWSAQSPGQAPYDASGGQSIGQQFGTQLGSIQQMRQMMAMMGSPYASPFGTMSNG